MTKNKNDINELLKVFWELPKKELELEWTKSTLFLLPMLNIELNKRKDILSFFENCFIGDKEFDHDYTHPIFVLLKTKDFKDYYYITTCNLFRNNKNYLMEYDVGVCEDYNLVMFVLDTPDEFKNDYYLFLQGKYSKLSEKLKNYYTQIITTKDGKSSVKNMAHMSSLKTDDLKLFMQQRIGLSEEVINELPELWDVPNVKREIYRY